MAQAAQNAGYKITVVIPVKNVAETVRSVFDITVKPLRQAGIVSSVVAVVSASPNDNTAFVANAHDARVVYREDVGGPEIGPSLGKVSCTSV